MRIVLPTILLFCVATTSAQLFVTVSPVKITGQRAVVPLALKNNFAESIESARAMVFLLDEQGKPVMDGHSRWDVLTAGYMTPKKGFCAIITRMALSQRKDFTKAKEKSEFGKRGTIGVKASLNK